MAKNISEWKSKFSVFKKKSLISNMRKLLKIFNICPKQNIGEWSSKFSEFEKKIESMTWCLLLQRVPHKSIIDVLFNWLMIYYH